MAYAVGHIRRALQPGDQREPCRRQTVRLEGRARYIVTQVVAAIAASATLWVIAVNHQGTTKASLAAGGFAANGYGDHSPGHYNLFAGLVIEIVLTAVFLVVIMGTPDKTGLQGFAALAIGLSLTLIHPASIPVTNTSVSPARSTGPAILLRSPADPGVSPSCGCSGWRRSSAGSSARSSTNSLPNARRSPTPPSWASPSAARHQTQTNPDRSHAQQDGVRLLTRSRVGTWVEHRASVYNLGWRRSQEGVNRAETDKPVAEQLTDVRL
jgi:hypothetical protein